VLTQALFHLLTACSVDNVLLQTWTIRFLSSLTFLFLNSGW